MIADVRVRKAVLVDARCLADLHIRSWRVGYCGLLPQPLLDGLDPAARLARWEVILQATDWPAEGTLVVEDGAELVGFAWLCPERDTALSAVGEVAGFHVAPDHWRTGIGRRLMSADVAQFADAGFQTAILWVLSGNDRAIQFYEATGWQVDGAARSKKSEALGGITVTELRMSQALV
jgi:GNAT superfamily N-acetyltransferase